MHRLIALLVSGVLATTALAGDDKSKAATQGKDSRITATFEELDKNADQQISRTEAAADKHLASNFASIDANGDGYISKSEFAARTKT
jgi:Ca2+-binding EF-hand superfamily protein